MLNEDTLYEEIQRLDNEIMWRNMWNYKAKVGDRAGEACHEEAKDEEEDKERGNRLKKQNRKSLD